MQGPNAPVPALNLLPEVSDAAEIWLKYAGPTMEGGRRAEEKGDEGVTGGWRVSVVVTVKVKVTVVRESGREQW
ncbi:hypothetical protein EOD39_5368 [Acipenser ruthenus]|uniref:Uncharacterized protein n=1 Tax=Acipenser ruthenus TaxID=7906 RepID=A0A444UE94_ACIRT|nr:hypothetical protein EOD39_5368 [Acipenser ruthenus]